MNRLTSCLTVLIALAPTVVGAQSTLSPRDVTRVPRGVILVVIDDIGYGDIDILYPSSLETPNLDSLSKQSLRLTDFHVGTTCAPTRASLLTGRSVNAGGVWHTIAGRELLRENEQTMAEVFRANGWKTGIFGKWHLGEGYPFSPRFRGFDMAVIHGGGGVGQGPDYWQNDYYSGVDQNGEATQADVYLKNGQPVTADKFCTDYWFDLAKQFVRRSIRAKQPFFCYLPTNAAHSPFNEPHGYKDGFDGLVENIDDNMGKLDEFLAAEGIKDDVLLIFTCDNGTTGPRLGGLRNRKGSHYDGGHNVPCFWRWKNGGIGGSTEAARDVDSLTAAMDLLPTFLDLFELDRPTGGRALHGVSLKEMLLNPNYTLTDRTVVVDTQREANFNKWNRACVMRDEVADGVIAHKWRLIRSSAESELELYDFLIDRDTDNDIAASHQTMVRKLSKDYDSWWTDVSLGREDFPPFVVNADKEGELTLFAHSWIEANSSPWHQRHILNAAKGTRTHSIRFDRGGRYRFELRRWPREDAGPIAGTSSTGDGKVIPATKARMTITGVGEVTKQIESGSSSVIIEMEVTAGQPTTLVTAFLDEENNVLAGAYYVYIKSADES